MSEKTKVNVNQAGIGCLVWAAGWLFTIGFLKLSFWKGLLALIIWPYYLGDYFSKLIGQ
jgi:hypothetical protein